MRWGGRKSASSSSSRPSFISHVSPLSWLSRFKQMRINSESSPGRLQQKGNPKSLSVGLSQYACGNGGRFHDGDGGGPWRLPFGEESHESKKGKDVLKTEFYNLEDEHVVPSSSCSSGRWNDKKHGRKEGTLKFKKKDRGTGEERKILKDTKIPLEIDDEYNREKEFEKLRRTFERKAQRVLQERVLKLEKAADKAASAKSEEKDALQLESPRTICTPRRHSFVRSLVSKNSSLGSLNEGGLFSKQSLEKTDSPSEEKLGFERQHLKKIEMKARKTKHSSKVRIHSPRMASRVEICKIKALEDMKKAKLKMKKEKERMLEDTAALDGFAVVKCSSSPEKDFRDSMVEMITELQLNQPEEMEELLACYLTLNSDDYHDLIVKVFREVWFDMNEDILGIT